VRERNEHLTSTALALADIVLDDRVAAGETVLLAQPVIHALGGMALLAVGLTIPVQPRVDDLGEPVQLRALDRRRAPVTRRHRERQHLRYAVARNVEMTRCLSLAHPFATRQANLQIQIHGVNLPALLAVTRRAKVDDFYAARTANMAALPWSNFAPPFSIVARLRNRAFFSLEELNAAIREELTRLNARVSRHLGASRQQLFGQLDKPALIPLPPTRHVHADWRSVTVGGDYHIRILDHYYSVPYGLVRAALWVRITASTIEAFQGGKRVASHQRAGPGDGRDTTVKAHMPAKHRHYAEMTAEKVRTDAQTVGPNVATLVEVILRNKPRPEQGIRACAGILKLKRGSGPERLDAACARALALNACSLKSVTSILKNRLETQPVEAAPEAPTIAHTNIRGAHYFH
jgi:hypothetical protein